MRRYLANMHKRPDSHKKNFALAVSGGFTLIIFAFWTFFTFGEGATLAKEETKKPANEVSPLSSLSLTVASTWDEISGLWGNIKSSFGTTDLEAGYEEMRDQSLNTYGR